MNFNEDIVSAQSQAAGQEVGPVAARHKLHGAEGREHHPAHTRHGEHLVSTERFRSLGVDYTRVITPSGDLYLTKYGLPHREALLPRNWFSDNYYIHHGHKLEGTSSVYRVKTMPAETPSDKESALEIVVKHCRIGQEIALETSVPAELQCLIGSNDIANARWNGPFEEFGKVMELRKGEYGPANLSVITQEPLGIFVPDETINPDHYGRSADFFRMSNHVMSTDNQHVTDEFDPLLLDITKQYYMLYSWLKGVDARELRRQQLLDDADLAYLTLHTFRKLQQKGFLVLDNKPAHIILLREGDHELIKRQKECRYGVVDYELLIRTQDYEKHHRLSRRRQYWFEISRRYDPAIATTMAPGLTSVKILGIPYVFGPTVAGGKLWVVGYNPGLFEYFQPARWRNAPRIRLSGTTDKFHTITPGNIHLVYRRSRVGILPESDPLQARPSPITTHGYNSPFEEVFFAETLRHAGIKTVYPRAIYRTGQRSELTSFLLDERRYEAMRDLMTPEDPPEPVLSPTHEYYTIWGCWRGIDPEKDYLPGAHYGLTTIEQVLNDNILSEAESQAIMESATARLRRFKMDQLFIGRYDFLLSFNPDRQTLKRDCQGNYEITICLDAFCAYHYHLLNAQQYREIMETTREDLRRAGCEMLNLAGSHILLSANPDGLILREDNGHFTRTLCNFELMKPLPAPPI
jgi:hypothetical protein